MKPTFLFRTLNLYLRYTLYLQIFVSFFSGNLYSQAYPRETVIASYIFHFAQNTQWANEDKMETIHFLIISSDKKVFEELNKISQKKKIRDKTILITMASQLTNVENFQLIFLADDKEKDMVDVFDKIEGKNILLISDNYDNKKMVMINFYETNEHKLKFEINKNNIINQRLVILPEMVLLGGTEIDVAELYHQSQVSLRTIQKQVEALQLFDSELKKKNDSSKQEMIRQQHFINLQAQSIDSLAMQLTLQKQESQKLFSDIKLKQETLNKQNIVIAKHEKELEEQKGAIIVGENVLRDQKEKIILQDKKIVDQWRILKQQGSTISKQQNVVYLLIIILVFGIGLFVAIYKGYKNKKETNDLLSKEIKERKKIEEALGKSEDLYNNAPCGYHSLDKNGVFLYINDTELRWLGYQREEIVGKLRFSDIITEKSRVLFQNRFPEFKASGMVNDLEFEIVRKDGSIFQILLNSTAILDNEGNYIMNRSSLFDITLRKKAEEELKLLNLELESRVAERTSQLEAANKELEAFSYSVSHDLRSPLRGIKGFSQLLVEEYQDRMDSTCRNYLERIQHGTERMAQLIEDLLKLSKITRTDMNIQLINISAIANEITDNLRETEPDRKVNFIIQKDIVVKGDGRLIRIALENLLGNSWKYTSKHDSATIEFGASSKDDKQICFVRDDGAGFDMRNYQKLFGAFQRLHDPREFPGTGIGLATIFRIVQRHGGEIWAEGEVEKGATFYFTLPGDPKS